MDSVIFNRKDTWTDTNGVESVSYTHLEQQVAKLKRENETLRKESEAMRKALNKRDLNLIKNF